MADQIVEKPSALNVKSIEDVMYLLRESEEKGGSTSAKDAYLQGQKELSTLFSSYTK